MLDSPTNSARNVLVLPIALFCNLMYLSVFLHVTLCIYMYNDNIITVLVDITRHK